MRSKVYLYTGIMLMLTSLNSFSITVIAHRGASAYAPENSLKSISIANKLKSDLIEIDVQLTKDNKVVLMHDKTVDRTTSLIGKTSNFTLDELRAQGIPSLREVLSLKLESKLIIEVKSDDLTIVSKIVTLIADTSSKKRVIYKSFNRDILKEFRRLDPEVDQIFVFVTSMWGITVDTSLRFKSADELIDVEYYQLHYSFLNRSFISKLHSKNKKVILWGVNSKEKYLKSKELKVFGIETDYPDLKFI